jgi:hypothetical protein
LRQSRIEFDKSNMIPWLDLSNMIVVFAAGTHSDGRGNAMTTNDRFYDPNNGEIEYICGPEDFRPGSGDVLALLLGDEPTVPASAKPASAAKAKSLGSSERPKSKHQRRPYEKDVGVAYMSAEERREYNAERQRERRANIKRREAELNAVTFDVATSREALADAALMILASNSAGSAAIRSYLAAVYRTQPGAPMTLEGWIRSGVMKPKLLKYTQPAKT